MENKIDSIANTKINLINGIETEFEAIGDRISADILNLELAILHQYKIYDEQAQNIQEIFDCLSNNLDYLFSEHRKTLHFSIDRLLTELASNAELLQLKNRDLTNS